MATTPLQDNLEAVFVQIGTDVGLSKKDIIDLQTAVGAIGAISPTAVISDAAGAGVFDKTWSADKLIAYITAAATQAKDDIINGAPAALDTLLEIANQLAADQTALGALVLALDAAIRTDIVQTFTDAQKTQAQENMGVTASTMMASYTAAKAAAMV